MGSRSDQAPARRGTGNLPLAALRRLVGDDFQVHPFYARILDHLDRPVPGEAGLRAQWGRDVLRLRVLWSGRH
ncbi:hypothetical protein ACN6LA_000171 [Streptomyces sp. SAS_269]|uniref:hypothetical protein n=1 Tax=Streptomyces sp. SAS_269 TaxID=3412749 RepID=UPI00403CA97B